MMPNAFDGKAADKEEGLYNAAQCSFGVSQYNIAQNTKEQPKQQTQ